MNQFIRIMVVVGIIAVLGTVIQAIIPDALGSSVHSNFVYFLSSLHALDNILPTNAIFSIIILLLNFWIALSLVKLVFFIVRHINGNG